jgi:DNA-directed RNA polymerase III subunit RPC3
VKSVGLATADAVQRIFTILLRRGRLPIHSLGQHTRLTRRQLRHGLVVLIQQNLVYYFEEGETTYYEANQDSAYGLVRSGKILEVLESRYGALARDLVLNLFLLGHTRVCDLADAYRSSNEAVAASSTGWEDDTHVFSAGKVDSMLYDLLEAGFVEPVVEAMFRSPDDTYNNVEKTILRDEFTGGPKGTKQKEQMKNRIRDKLESIRSEGRDWKRQGTKRAWNGVTGTNGDAKRRKLANGDLAVNGNHDHEDEDLRLEVGFSGFYERDKVAC